MDYKWTSGASVHWKKSACGLLIPLDLAFEGERLKHTMLTSKIYDIWRTDIYTEPAVGCAERLGNFRWPPFCYTEIMITTSIPQVNHLGNQGDQKTLLATRGARSITLFCWFSRDHRQIYVSLKPRAHFTADHWKMRSLLALGLAIVLACRGNRHAVSKHCCYNTGQWSETAKGTLNAGVHSTKSTLTGATNLVLFIDNYQLFRECVPCVAVFATLTNINQLRYLNKKLNHNKSQECNSTFFLPHAQRQFFYSTPSFHSPYRDCPVTAWRKTHFPCKIKHNFFSFCRWLSRDYRSSTLSCLSLHYMVTLIILPPLFMHRE